MSNDLILKARFDADALPLVTALKEGKAGLKDQGDEARRTGDALKSMAGASAQAGAGSARMAGQLGQATKSMGAAKAGAIQLGQNLQDVFVQIQTNTSGFVIFAQQGGQLIGALALMAQGADGSKGKLAALAGFMAGPWGIALGVGITVVGALASALLDADDAAEKVKFSTDALSGAQGILGSVMDLTTGKINTQRKELIALAIAQAQLAKLQAEGRAASLRGEVEAYQHRAPGIEAGFGGGISFVDRNPQLLKVTSRQLLDGEINATDALKRLDSLRRTGEITEDVYSRAAAAVASLGVELGNVKIQESALRMLEGDGTNADRALLLKPDKPKKPKSNKGAADRLANFGLSADDKIADIRDQYSDLSSDIVRANAATRDLDRLIADLEKRKPPNFERLIAQARAVKPLIEESLGKPFRDMLQSQERQIALGELAGRGRANEATALQLSYSLMDRMGARSEEQLATMLAQRGVRGDEVRQLYDGLDVLRLQTRELEIQQQRQGAYLNALADIRGGIHDTIAALRTEGAGAGKIFWDRFMSAADQLFADRLSEALFGDVFRALEDQVTGEDKVSKAGKRMADAVDLAAKSMATTRNALDDLSRAATGAADRLAGRQPTVTPSSSPSSPAPDGEDIVVTAKNNSFIRGYEEIIDGTGKVFDKVLGKVFGPRGLFSEAMGATLGKAFGGSQVGMSIGNSLARAIGSPGSSFGSAIGGAVGQAAGTSMLGFLGSAAGPIGAIAGGLLGGLVGGLFKKSPAGSAVITSASTPARVTGNSGDAQQALSSISSTLQSGLKQIAEQLGGELGSFAVSIGKRNDYYRVSASGSPNTGDKYFSRNNADALYDGTDAQAALMIAMANAISDGAVKGLSAGVEKALRKSSNVEDALAEALKVQQVELLAGGPGAELQKALKDFGRQEAERLRIAREYGFDMVAIEKRNAEDRAKIVDDYLKSRVSSLEDFLKDMRYGSLAEGSPADRRQALLAEIDKAKADALAGIDGAADNLADLNRRLIELSRDAYGTAGGEYAGDRATGISAAEAVIKAENDRIKAAQDAVAQTNQKLDQGNAIAAETNKTLEQILQALRAGGYMGGISPLLAQTGRSAL